MIVPSLVACFLRFRGLNGQTLWADELHVANAARRGVVGAVQEAAADVYPPLHYALCALLGGDAAEVVRLPSVVAGVLAVVVVTLAARRAGSTMGAWIAGGWLALLPAHIHYAQEARSYALLGLFFVGLVAAQERWRQPVLAAWCTSLCLYTHGLAPLFLLGPLAAAIWRRDLTALLALGVGALSFLPWLAISLTQRSRFLGWGGYEVPPSQILSDVVGFFGAGGLDGALPLWTGGLMLGLGALSALQREQRPLLLAVALPFVALLVSAVGMNAVTAKHFTPLLPAFALLLAGIQARGRLAGLVGMVLALGSGILGLHNHAERLPVRFDLQGVVEATRAVRAPGTPVSGAFPNMWRYYLRDEPVLALPPTMDLARAREILAWQQDTFRGRASVVWWWMQAGQDRVFFEMDADWPSVWIVERAGAEGMGFATDPGHAIPLARAQLENTALEHRDRTLAFYGRGTAIVPVDRDGILAVWAHGSLGEGRAPTLGIQVADRTPESIRATVQLERHVLGEVRAGQALTLTFADDYAGASGDRNVWVTRIEVFTEPPR